MIPSNSTILGLYFFKKTQKHPAIFNHDGNSAHLPCPATAGDTQRAMKSQRLTWGPSFKVLPPPARRMKWNKAPGILNLSILATGILGGEKKISSFINSKLDVRKTKTWGPEIFGPELGSTVPMELRLKQFNKRLNRDFKSNVLKFFGQKNTVQIARAMAWWGRKHCITSAGLSKRTCIKTLITISYWRRNYYGAVTWYRISCCESDTYYTNLSKTLTVWRHFFETYQFHPISVRLQSIKLTYSARKLYPLAELVVKAWWLNPPHERFLG